MTPVAAMAVNTFARSSAVLVNVPIRIRNSPMKPFVPGKATDASVISRNAPTSLGITAFNPPNSAICRV